MIRYTTLLIATAAVTFATGCGTVSNIAQPCHASVLMDPNTPGGPADPSPEITLPPAWLTYGGVRLDYDIVCSLAREPVSLRSLFIPLAALDLPLSLVGDTLTLPFTVDASTTRSINEYYFPKTAADVAEAKAADAFVGKETPPARR